MNCKCSAPLADGFYVCTTCGESLAYALAEVDGVVEVLDAGVARTSLTAGYGERVSSSGPLHAPLPINEAVFDARHALHTYLMRTALKLAEVTGPLTGRSSQGIAAYLIRNLDALRRQDWAPGVEHELRGHLRHGHDHANRSEGKVFAGQCAECQSDLYAAKGDQEARCRTCGTSYEVLKWRAHAATAKDYYIGSATDLSRKLSAPQYGYTVSADQIRKWALRDKITRANPEADEQGKAIAPAYRLGDVLDLVQQRLAKYPINGAA
jgi:DNA-directed RNA polymerase subunit RPC12/RpoP